MLEKLDCVILTINDFGENVIRGLSYGHCKIPNIQKWCNVYVWYVVNKILFTLVMFYIKYNLDESINVTE